MQLLTSTSFGCTAAPRPGSRKRIETFRTGGSSWGGTTQKTNVRRLVSDWLKDETNKRWLIVLDNADNIETFFSSQMSQRDEADASAQIPLATSIFRAAF
jgi:hypothetical protein